MNSVEDDEISSAEKIFSYIKDVLSFDYAMVYYINDERISLKYKKSCLKDDFIDNLEQYTKINDLLKKQLYNEKNYITDEKDRIVKALNINIPNTSYIITKLYVKSIVFGVLIFVKKDKNFYKPFDLEIAQTLAAVVSY